MFQHSFGHTRTFHDSKEWKYTARSNCPSPTLRIAVSAVGISVAVRATCTARIALDVVAKANRCAVDVRRRTLCVAGVRCVCRTKIAGMRL